VEPQQADLERSRSSTATTAGSRGGG